jgi:hypothetical protein
MGSQERIVRFVNRCNWVIFFIAVLASLCFAGMPFTTGVVVGGLIVTVNFCLLERTLRNTFRSNGVVDSYKSVILKYYIRFTASGIILFVLMGLNFLLEFKKGIVFMNPLGLVLGLSVVAASFMLATLLEIKKLIFKEAV